MQKSRLRLFLDKLFSNKKLSFFLPLTLAGGMYLLFLLFGLNKYNSILVILTPIMAAIFVGVIYLIFYIQVKTSFSRQWVFDLNVFLILIITAIGTIVLSIRFLLDIKNAFSPFICLGPVAWSLISLAHNKRS